MTDYLGDGRLRSLLTGEELQIAIDAKIVDATYYGTSVPATYKPKFEVAPDVRLMSALKNSKSFRKMRPAFEDIANTGNDWNAKAGEVIA